jgi:adsorption protein B
MDGWGLIFAIAGFVQHELMLFAAFGFLLLGTGDLLVDAIWIGRTVRQRSRRYVRASAETLGGPEHPGHLAVFIPAWDEAAVIGDMLRTTLGRFDHPGLSPVCRRLPERSGHHRRSGCDR